MVQGTQRFRQVRATSLRNTLIAKMVSHAIFQYNVLVIDIDNTTLGLIEKFAKMGLQTLAFAVLPLAPHFIGTDGPTMSFTGSGNFTSGQCLQS